MASSADSTDFAMDMMTSYRGLMEEGVNQYYNEESFDRIGDFEEIIQIELPYTARLELFIECLSVNRQVNLEYKKRFTDPDDYETMKEVTQKKYDAVVAFCEEL
jgi:hypothetical protein